MKLSLLSHDPKESQTFQWHEHVTTVGSITTSNTTTTTTTTAFFEQNEALTNLNQLH